MHVSACKGSASVDLAALLLGSMADLHTHEAALAMFKCVHAALAPDGLFVIELGLPGDTFDGSFLLVSPLFFGCNTMLCYQQQGA